jgi:predicted ATPase
MSRKLPPIIGLTGFAGSGKDTVRDILEDMGFVGFAFADPIRAMLRELLSGSGLDDKWMECREFKEEVIPELGVSYRQMAQMLGTEWGRSLHADFWVRLAGAYVADIQDQSFERAVNFVVSDVRFENEANFVRERGGVIWRIDRPGVERVRDHASEQQIESIAYDTVVPNDGDFDALRVWVERLLA